MEKFRGIHDSYGSTDASRARPVVPSPATGATAAVLPAPAPHDRYYRWDVEERATASDGENEDDDYYCYSFDGTRGPCEALDLTLKKKPDECQSSTSSSGVSLASASTPGSDSVAGSSGSGSGSSLPSSSSSSGASSSSSVVAAASPPHILKFRLLQAVAKTEEDVGEPAPIPTVHEEPDDQNKVRPLKLISSPFNFRINHNFVNVL